jgi:hypothetical protein
VSTRIEIDGFKTFRGFELELRPFMVIAGANATGKSNLFDAVQLLARLAEDDLRTAVSSLRGEPYRWRGAGARLAERLGTLERPLEERQRDCWVGRQRRGRVRHPRGPPVALAGATPHTPGVPRVRGRGSGRAALSES